MWPCLRLITAERDGYFAICPSLRPNLAENEVYQRVLKKVSGTLEASENSAII